MTNVGEYPVVLLIDHEGAALLPLNQRGLSRTQKNRRRLKAEYSNAELLLPTGELLPIQDFKLGRTTDTGLSGPFAWLSFTGERYLTIIFGPPREEALERSKATILEYLGRENHRDEWLSGTETWSALLQNVGRSESYGQIFEALHLTKRDDGLDVFS